MRKVGEKGRRERRKRGTETKGGEEEEIEVIV